MRPRLSSLGSIKVDYKLFTNVVGLVVFAVLFALTMRRGVTDPVCGMKADKAKAIPMDFGGETFYFCSEHCRHAFEINPDDHRGRSGTPTKAKVADIHSHR